MPIRITPAVKALLIAFFAAFIVQHSVDLYTGSNVVEVLFGLEPDGFVSHFRIWQLVTYVFLHAEVLHLFLNLMMLAFIGGELEAVWGTRRFVSFFFFCSTAAGIFYLLLELIWPHGLHSVMIGASGGIYGILMAYGLIFGERVLLFMLLFPMKAKHFIWILAAVEFMSTVFSSRGGGIANAAHIGGMIAGFGYLYMRATLTIVRRRKAEGLDYLGRPKKPKKRRGAGHLKLVINNPKDDDEDSDHKPRTWH